MLIKLINDQPLKKREVLVPVKYKKGDTLQNGEHWHKGVCETFSVNS